MFALVRKLLFVCVMEINIAKFNLANNTIEVEFERALRA